MRAPKPSGWRKWSPEGDPKGCVICNRPFYAGSAGSYPAFDHCHSCGAFRNWLCLLCNRAEGLYPRQSGYTTLNSRLKSKSWRLKVEKYRSDHKCGQIATSEVENVIFA